MEAKELRIGNYIYTCSRMEAAITGINANGVDYTYLEENAGDGNSVIESINPVKITEEWLLMLGFKDGVKPINFYNKIVSSELVLSKSRNAYIAIIEPKGASIYHTQIIKYVHQLQNLYFALTGEEL